MTNQNTGIAFKHFSDDDFQAVCDDNKDELSWLFWQGFDHGEDKEKWDKKPDIKWNFTKFVIDRESNDIGGGYERST